MESSDVGAEQRRPCSVSKPLASSADLTTNANPTGCKRQLSQSEAATAVTKKPLLEGAILQFDDICDRCSLILPAIMSFSNATKREGIFVADLGSHENWSKASCRLCSFFLSFLSDSKRVKSYHLEAFGALVLFPDIPPSNAYDYLAEQKGTYFGVVPASQNRAIDHTKANYLALLSGGSDSQDRVHVRLMSDEVNYQLLSGWISECKTHPCQFANPPYLPWRLIDCHNRTIISPRRDSSYIALSYVWGEKEPPKPIASGKQAAVLPKNLPKTISDAMEVTRRLGRRYLWVDKFCINREDSETERIQFRDMHLVYGGAELTIFAASGQDGDSGLPGVNGTRRRSQARSLIKGTQFASTLVHPLSRVMESKWSTRGWTYQEAVLSYRRLFFTEEQTYFMCNSMQYWESIHIPLDKLKKARAKVRVGPKMQFKLCSGRKRHRLAEFMGHVREYSGRNLSHTSDSFNAFAGILRKFELDDKYPISNLWGLPIIPGSALESFVHALTWVHNAEDNPNPIKRRHDFPSYSFVGWEGKASLQTQIMGVKVQLKALEVSDVEIQVATVKNELCGLEDITKLEALLRAPHSSLQLRIKARMLPADIWARSISTAGFRGAAVAYPLHFEVMMQLPDRRIKCRAEVSGQLTDDEFLAGVNKGELTCLLLGYETPKSRDSHQTSCHHFLMIVKEDSAKVAERVGILSFTLPGEDFIHPWLMKETRWFVFESAQLPQVPLS